MVEPMIRGHVIQHTAKFFRSEVEPDLALSVDGGLSLELKTTLREIAPAAWYPRQLQVELLRAVAAAHGDEGATRHDLQRCGAAMAVGDNEFMKLLVKVLTPELFLRKASRFWSRDHQDSGGCHLERLDSDGHSGCLRLRGVAGYAHSGLLWLGWMQAIFEEMGLGGAEIVQEGWTWSNPAPDEVLYEVKWS